VASVVAQVARHEFEIGWPAAADLFDANQESNLPTLYSTLALLLAGLLLGGIGATERSPRNRLYWFGLVALFAVAVIDETAAIHEKLNEPLRSLLGTSGRIWEPELLASVLVLGAAVVIFRPFVKCLPRPVQRLGAGGVVLFAAGTLAVESVQNLLADSNEEAGLAWALVGTLSELCEMVGVVLILEALLLYIALERRSMSLTIRPTANAGAD
jgi:hypothetical protein